MTLATTVAVPALRGPAATAKMLAAIDVLSGGRLIVGVGPGSSARDYELVGVPFEQRWKRLDEAIHTMRAYWSGAGKRFEGEFYSTAGAAMDPTPVQRPGPPIWIGSWGSAAGLRRVALLADGWLASGYNTTPESFGSTWPDLLAQVSAAGRDASRFPNGIATMWCYVSDERARAEARITTCCRRCSTARWRSSVQNCRSGAPEDCAATLSSYRAAGAQRIFLGPLGEERYQLERFRRDVIPLVD